MNQGSWKDCSIWDHLHRCITIQCELSMLPWDPYQKPKRDPWAVWESLILHHVCMKPVSACPTDRALLPSSRPFSRKKVARQQSPCQLLRTEWWFLVLFVFSQQQFILSYVLNEAWSKVNMYFDTWSSLRTHVLRKLVFYERPIQFDLGWNSPISRISLFARHVNYCWLLSYNYRIQMLFIGLSAVSHSNPSV